MSREQLNYSILQHDDISIIEFNETRFDNTKAPAFKTQLLHMIAEGKKRILLNMENVQFIDSSGLGALTFGKRQLNEIDGEITLCCLKEKVFSLLKIAKLDRVFTIYETVDKALESK